MNLDFIIFVSTIAGCLFAIIAGAIDAIKRSKNLK
jgi:hypothetical protein